jgi:poly-gamma-glutamate capsule biosynthesis protein CapA/YwtB (metallophosphatase superfamily)
MLGITKTSLFKVAKILVSCPGLLMLCIALSILPSSRARSQEISIAIVGDIMFGPDISRIMDKEGSLAPFAGTVDILKDADVTFGILEGGIGTRGEAAQDKEHTFRSKPTAARGLLNAGFDVLSLANPHIMDYGEEGFLDTLEFLSWYGLKYVGGGTNAEEARKPVVLTAKDVKVGFLAYYRRTEFDQFFGKMDKIGPALPIYGELEQDMAKAKEQADVVIVSMHWGIQVEESGITSRQRLFAHKLIDSGADVVVGQWLHKTQGIEIYKGKPVIYSLGDFIYGTYAKKIPIGFILKFVFSGSKLLRVEIIPLSTSDAKTESYFPVVLHDEAAENVIKTLRDLSREFGTDIQTKNDTGIIYIDEVYNE